MVLEEVHETRGGDWDALYQVLYPNLGIGILS